MTPLLCCSAFGSIIVRPIIRNANRSRQQHSATTTIVKRRRLVSVESNNLVSSSDVPSPSFPSKDERSIRRAEHDYNLERALDHARDVDKKHGLGTESSLKAWAIVDELYMLATATHNATLRRDCRDNDDNDSSSCLYDELHTHATARRLREDDVGDDYCISATSNNNERIIQPTTQPPIQRRQGGAQLNIIYGGAVVPDVRETEGRKYYF
eukprot:CAMPEP_0181114878 /NCGR_PEP_ID=MMETSP1071-20121207/21136_1 /TAXON_ID=35127 /ORGANISM="Thalassiosira sp., Strain NH16" /LENGTH=210 /DNA_ID=CAMNT_0023199053 /DNA_START=174 /DNA_END=806 /DNA_ORIENTATION=-